MADRLAAGLPHRDPAVADLLARGGRLVLAPAHVVDLVGEGGEPAGRQLARRRRGRSWPPRPAPGPARPAPPAGTAAGAGRRRPGRPGVPCPPAVGERLRHLGVGVHPAERPGGHRHGRQLGGGLEGDRGEHDGKGRRVHERPRHRARRVGPPAEQRPGRLARPAGRSRWPAAGARRARPPRGRFSRGRRVHPHRLGYAEDHGVPHALPAQVRPRRREELGHVTGRLPCHGGHGATPALAQTPDLSPIDCQQSLRQIVDNPRPTSVAFGACQQLRPVAPRPGRPRGPTPSPRSGRRSSAATSPPADGWSRRTSRARSGSPGSRCGRRCSTSPPRGSSSGSPTAAPGFASSPPKRRWRSPSAGWRWRRSARSRRPSASPTPRPRSCASSARTSSARSPTATRCRYSELNRELHRRVGAISGQHVAIGLLDRLHGQLVRHQFQLALRPGRPEVSLAEHLAILEAVADRRPHDANLAVRAHLASVIEALLACDQPDQPAAAPPTMTFPAMSSPDRPTSRERDSQPDKGKNRPC